MTMRLHVLRVFVVMVLLVPISAVAQNFSNGFNFYLPADDSTQQLFLPDFPAFEIEDFIEIDAEGHFTSNGVPLRFWGVNLTTNSCFPVKEKASFVAARMRKMGINLVRFHHMDNPWSDNEGTIFLRSADNTRTLDPLIQDRLHYFLARMKANGVYANMNLHVSRTFQEGDGVPQADSIWNFAKGVTYFDPHLITLQKEFATQLLTAENPYTGLKMIDDPVLAQVEITNENTLYGMWKSDQLKNYTQGGVLIKRHDEMLNAMWQDFLEEKYASDEILKSVWAGNEGPAAGESQVMDGSFEGQDLHSSWNLGLFEGGAATMSISNSESQTGSQSLQIEVTAVTGTDWHVQFNYDGLSMRKDTNYVLEFWAKADRPGRNINVGFQEGREPWTWYTGTGITLSEEWRPFRVSLAAPENLQNFLRITFNASNETGTVWIDDIKFSEPIKKGLENSESLVGRNVRRVEYSERLLFSPSRLADQAEFYLNIQRSYFQEMYRFLKEEVGVKVPVTGTNALAGISDLYTEQDLDYIDDHSYWSHPYFPSVPWSQTDWLIENVSLLYREDLGSIGGIFSGLAMKNKPYTVSEYNHPFPNRYQWEMMPLLGSYASLHDADGLMFFEYNGDKNSDWESDFIDGFFSIHRNNSLMSMSPIWGYIYRQGLIPPSEQQYEAGYTSDYIFNLPQVDNMGRWGKYLPYNPRGGAIQSIRTTSFENSEVILPEIPNNVSDEYMAINQSLIWEYTEGLHSVNAPRVQAVTGALNNSIDRLANLYVQSSSDEGAITWVSLTDESLQTAERSLLSVNSQIQNSGMVWDGDQTVHNQWGSAPTEIKALQVSLELRIDADSLHVYPLDNLGAESEYFSIFPIQQGLFEVLIDQTQYETPWFGIESFGQVTSSNDNNETQDNFYLYPNPTGGDFRLNFRGRQIQEAKVELLSINGTQLKVWEWNKLNQTSGFLNIDEFTSGFYLVRITSDRGQWTGKLMKI